MLQIARILKSNGTEGAVLIGLRDFPAGDIDTKEPVFIEFDGLPVPFFIESVQPRGTSKAIITLTDVSCLEDAEELVGRDIFLDGEWEDDEEEDFIGWKVFDRGKSLGEVVDIEPIPGNFCIIVGGDEIMIPLHEDFVVSLDEDKREMYLDLPEGDRRENDGERDIERRNDGTLRELGGAWVFHIQLLPSFVYREDGSRTHVCAETDARLL